jgi:GNAT superfamily N-acetyltransferase
MLEIVKLNPEMKQALTSFFVDVAKDDYARYYHPYSLTPESAEELCALSGEDLHYVLIDSQTILGHGMLRGWDEGYSVPSLGIVIHPDAAHKGLGSMFVRFLHSAAWAKGCTKIRLAVYKDNVPALKMYKKLGYTFVSKNEKELVGTLLKRKGIMMFKFDPSIIAIKDPVRAHNWAKYCECKYQIAKDIKPDVIVEIGVRAGYSAWALLQANPKAMYYGFDANLVQSIPSARGGPWSPVAEKMLKSRGYNVKMWHDFNSQTHNNLPVAPDPKQTVLYHIDGEHSVKGVYNDLELCFHNAHVNCFILVDDYNKWPSLVVKQGTDKWIAEHRDLVEVKVFPDTGNGDILIKIKGK